MKMIIIPLNRCTLKAGKWYWDEYSMILTIFLLQPRRQKKKRRRKVFTKSWKKQREQYRIRFKNSRWETLTIYLFFYCSSQENIETGREFRKRELR